MFIYLSKKVCQRAATLITATSNGESISRECRLLFRMASSFEAYHGIRSKVGSHVVATMGCSRHCCFPIKLGDQLV